MREAKILGDTANCEAGEDSGGWGFREKVLNESGEPAGCEIPRVRSEIAERLVRS